MSNTEDGEWVVVAQFNAMDTGLAADMAVSKLQGNGVSAVRVPTGSITSVLVGGMPAVEVIRVLVPPNQADRAREILTEEP